MAIRYQVSLAHQGCPHTGMVVWEERGGADAIVRARPIVVSLPRGFVSVTADDGSVEILCSGCTQTVAAATAGGPASEPHGRDETPASGTNPEPSEPSATASDLDMLFAEHPDVQPIRGESIPHHLVDRLRDLASRWRGATV